MVGQELKTITPNMRQVGIFNIRGGGEDLPKQPPAIVSPGAIRRVTRARGEDTSIPQVEIYVDDQGAAGQEAPGERLVSKAQREARKRLGTRKEIMEAEKEVLERKIAKQVKREEVIEEKTPSGVIKKVIKEKVEVPALMDIDRKEIKARKTEAKAKIAEAEAKKAQAEAFAEMYKNMTYLQYVNKRAKELQSEKSISWKEAKSDATDEWKSNKGYVTEMSISSADEVRGKKGKKSESDHPSDGTIDIKIKKPAVKVETIEEGGGSGPARKHKIKHSEETKKRLEEEAKKKEEEAKKKAAYEKEVREHNERLASEAKKRRDMRKKAGTSQRQIKEFVESLDMSELKDQFRIYHPRAAFPSVTKMKNLIIKSLGGEVYGGKAGAGTSEESSS
jgi:hypothetical protein